MSSPEKTPRTRAQTRDRRTDINPDPEPRIPLSMERVMRAAITLADQGGVESLTMRRLAQELGVGPMSLYYYVANKDDLLNAMLDRVMSEIGLPLPGVEWKETIRKAARSANTVLLRHRWALSLVMSPARLGPARMRFMDSLLRCLREAGFTADQTHHAYHALDGHIIGFTLWQVSIPIRKEEVADVSASVLEKLSADEYPDLVEHIKQHMNESSHGGKSEFEFGLDLILDGIERMRGNS